MSPTSSLHPRQREALLEAVEGEIGAISDLARDAGFGEPYCGQFARCLASLKGDRSVLIDAGAEFEARLDRHIGQALQHATGLLGDVKEREKSLSGKAEAGADAPEGMLERLGRARQRPELGPIFDRYLPLVQQAVKDEFAALLGRLKTDVPEEIRTCVGADDKRVPRWLPSLEPNGRVRPLIFQPLRFRQLAREAAEVVESVLSRAVTAWLQAPADQPGAARAFARHLPALEAELRRVLMEISGDLRGDGQVAGALAGGCGGAFPRVLAVASPPGLVGGLVDVVSTRVVLGASRGVVDGITSLPIILRLGWSLPATINHNLLDRAAAATVRQLDEALEAMKPSAPSAASLALVLDARMAEAFNAFKAEFLRGAAALVDREVKEIQAELTILQGGLAAVAAELDRLARARLEIERCQARLAEMVAQARRAAGPTA